jgi:hypothetical protein
MIAKAALAAALLLAPTMAHATTWYVVSLNDNQCEDSQEVQRESAINGGPLFVSPQGLIDVMRYHGAIPAAEITKLRDGERMVTVSWVAPTGQTIGRVFFSSQADCQMAIAAAINAGIAAPVGSLR